MPYVFNPPNSKEYMDDIQNRLRKLETQRFTAPNVSAAPANPRKGDIWLNTATNQLNMLDANGTIRVITIV